MAKQQAVARKPSRSKRDKQQQVDSSTGGNAPQGEVASYEEELAGYLQERIKPGLNRGAIPLLARSIASEIALREHPNGTSQDTEADDEDSPEADYEDDPEADDEDSPEADYEDDPEADYEDDPEADDEDSPEADDDQSAESEEPSDFEDDMHELQAELGDDWIVRFSVQGDDAWLTAEKDDGSQRLEAPTADVLVEAVELLDESGGRST
jgi:hypothetical protein